MGRWPIVRGNLAPDATRQIGSSGEIHQRICGRISIFGVIRSIPYFQLARADLGGDDGQPLRLLRKEMEFLERCHHNDVSLGPSFGALAGKDGSAGRPILASQHIIGCVTGCSTLCFDATPK